MAIFTNQATISYNNTIRNSNVITGQILTTVSATKTAVGDDYTAGDDVTYVISILNSGNAPITDVIVTDDLGGYGFEGNTVYPLRYVPDSIQYYVNGVLQAPPSVDDGAGLVISGLTIPAGGNVMLIYETDITQYAPLDAEGSVTNTASVTGSCINEPVTATATITTQDEPNLTITKSLCPNTVTGCGQLTYTFIIQNTGNTEADADANVIITDDFDPAFAAIMVTFNGDAWTEGTDYTYNTETGEFATVAGRITVPAATFTQDETGAWVVNPGVSVLTVTGTL
ncbi:MAG: hypothetical protein IJ497_08975 [Clostridia bacterium]|nr:hypothetical protein [Clostridia bacterium]